MKRFLMPFVWLSVLFVAMLYGAMAHAAPPPCYHDSPTGSGSVEVVLYKEPTTIAVPDGGCVLWYCDAGHQWKPEGFCFTPTDAAQYSMDLAKSWAGLDTASRDQLWVNNVHPPMPGTIYERMIAWRDSLPKPTKAPPSGLVTQTPQAFKKSEQINGYKFSPIGAVPVGSACIANVSGTDSAGTYHAVADRSLVVMAKAGNYTPPKPTTVYARCLP